MNMRPIPVTAVTVVSLPIAVACAVVGPEAFGADGGRGDSEAPSFQNVTFDIGIDLNQVPASNFALGPVNISPMIGGGAAGDFNRDGFQDIFIASGGTSPDRLYLNNGDGTFTDVAEAAGIAEPHMGVGVCVGDYDNDGWLDLFVISYGSSAEGEDPAPGQHRLWRNNGVKGGAPTFTNMADVAGVAFSAPSAPDGWGPAFGDYDLDGDLDLFVPHWYGAANKLFMNLGDGTFEDVTVAAGLTGVEVRGFSGLFVDLNRDRYPELLVAADYGTSQYYINNTDGTFTRHTEAAGVGLDGNGMGHTVADFNGDGRLDWYVTSIDADHPIPPLLPGTGNMLYMGASDHVYTEASVPSGVNDGGWGWGTVAVDVNHDGHVDIVETNGWQGTNIVGEFEWSNEQCYLWLNDGNDGGAVTFTEWAPVCGLNHQSNGRGLIRLDIENDGDQDLVFFANGERVEVFENQLESTLNTRWIRIMLDTSGNSRLAPNGYGARVIADLGDRQLHQALTGGSTYISQNELSVHFGLGTHQTIESIRVEWNDGTVTRLADVDSNQHLTIASGNRNDINQSGFVDIDDLLAMLAAWGTASLDADLNADDVVNAMDLMVLLRNWD